MRCISGVTKCMGGMAKCIGYVVKDALLVLLF